MNQEDVDKELEELWLRVETVLAVAGIFLFLYLVVLGIRSSL